MYKMQRLEVSGAVQPIYGSLGFKRLRRWNRQSVLKCRHIKFIRRGIAQKKAYNLEVCHLRCVCENWKGNIQHSEHGESLKSRISIQVVKWSTVSLI